MSKGNILFLNSNDFFVFFFSQTIQIIQIIQSFTGFYISVNSLVKIKADN